MEKDKTKEFSSIISNINPNGNMISNPIETKKIMPLNMKTSSNRLYGGYVNNNVSQKTEIDYAKILKILNACFVNQNDPNNLFYEINNNISTKFDLNYCALGLFNQISNYIDIKLIDRVGASYNTKILLNDEDNIIVKAYLTKKVQVCSNSDFLKLTCLSNILSQGAIIVPLIANSECLGVFIFSDNNNNQYIEFYKLISNYFAIFYKNKVLSALVDKNTDIDSLSGLSNHKKLQEDLAVEIQNANPAQLDAFVDSICSKLKRR